MNLDPLSAIFDAGKMIISRAWPDPSQQAEQLLKLEELKQKGDLAELSSHVQSLTGQLDINKQEASHTSIFVAGWRPFVGWYCGIRRHNCRPKSLDGWRQDCRHSGNGYAA